ncbi:MAG: hypothetical protein HYU51_01625 [Candidatus Rokubacteria bacterium]|nr:hypothetical protein [Candidatus Rokubacteria bacterium]
MDWNEHYVVFLVRERLAEARSDAERRARLPRRPARRLRQRAGAALIRLGRRLAGEGVPLTELSKSVSRG